MNNIFNKRYFLYVGDPPHIDILYYVLENSAFIYFVYNDGGKRRKSFMSLYSIQDISDSKKFAEVSLPELALIID